MVAIKKDAREEEEEDDNISSLKNFVSSHLQKFFVDHIPVDSIKELPIKYVYYFGIFSYVTMAAVFIYFIYTSYINSVSQAYIALEDDGGNCNDVSIAVTGSYLADAEGNWIGSPSFDYSIAKYDINLNNFQASGFVQYEEMMLEFRQALLEVGVAAKNDNLAKNLLRWISFVRYYSVSQPSSTNLTSIGYGQLQYLQMTGDPLQIFSLNSYQVVLGSAYGFCPLSGYTTYDKANGQIGTTLNYTLFMNTLACAKCGDPSYLGYIPTVNNDVFPLALEVRAISTALSVNLGIIPITNLVRSGTDRYYFTIANTSYVAGEYYDLRYYQMRPIFCVHNVTAPPSGSVAIPDVCFIVLGETLALPVFNHFGTSKSYPSYCHCGTNGQDSECHAFNLMFGLIYFPVTSKTSSINVILLAQINNLFKLIMKHGSYSEVNNAAYNASWTASAQAYGQMHSTCTSNRWSNNIFKFCQLSATVDCSMIIYHTEDLTSQYVSPYKYDLTNGSCTDSFTVSDDVWARVVLQAPTQLTQDYFECYESDFSAFFSSVGIASGNTSLAVPLISIVLLPLLYILLAALRLTPPKQEYNKMEKQQALEILSLLLLRLRDGKTRGVNRKGVLMQLTKELIAAAKEEGGFPDSDDEDEEEDDQQQQQHHNQTPFSSNKNHKKGIRDDANDDDNDDDMRKERISHIEQSIDSDDEIETPSSSKPMNNNQRSSTAPKPLRSIKSFTRRGSGNNVTSATTTTATNRRIPRNQMAVFTKHLEEELEERQSNVGSMRPKSRRVSTKMNLIAEPSATTNEIQKSKGVWRYWTSSKSTHDKTVKATGATGGEQEMIDIHNKNNENPLHHHTIDRKYPDFSSNHIPSNVKVLNANAPTSLTRNTVTIEQLNELVDDMIRLGSTILNSKSSTTNNVNISVMNELIDLSCHLVQVKFDEFIVCEEQVLFMKLSNALCMHASVELNCGTREIESHYADTVAYNIGGKVLTVNNLMELASSL